MRNIVSNRKNIQEFFKKNKMAAIPTVLPPIEIEDNQHFPKYFELLQNVLLDQNIDNYTQDEIEERLFSSDEIFFFPPPIKSNVKLASKTECGYAILNTKYYYHIVWYIPLPSMYISKRLGSDVEDYAEGISFAFLFEWINERKIQIYPNKHRLKY